MTRKRLDSHSTEFGLWLREQRKIDSSLGYTATNIDYVWGNYFTGLWMLLEEKRYNRKPTRSQLETFRRLDRAIRLAGDRNYRGFHLLVFEKTNPADGKMWLDGMPITVRMLMAFLRFELTLFRETKYLGVFGTIKEDFYGYTNKISTEKG